MFTVPALRSVRARALPDPQNPESYEGGDARLQESLVNQIKFEIGKKQVRVALYPGTEQCQQQ